MVFSLSVDDERSLTKQLNRLVERGVTMFYGDQASSSAWSLFHECSWYSLPGHITCMLQSRAISLGPVHGFPPWAIGGLVQERERF